MPSASPEATRAAGAALGKALHVSTIAAPIVIYLSGELGAGKTTLVGGLLQALGVTGPVKSPTYTLIEPYDLGGRAFYHLDLYRVADPRELEMLALRDLLEPGTVLLVEWAERGGAMLPPADLRIRLAYAADPAPSHARSLRLAASSHQGESLLNKLFACAS